MSNLDSKLSKEFQKLLNHVEEIMLDDVSHAGDDPSMRRLTATIPLLQDVKTEVSKIEKIVSQVYRYTVPDEQQIQDREDDPENSVPPNNSLQGLKQRFRQWAEKISGADKWPQWLKESLYSTVEFLNERFIDYITPGEGPDIWDPAEYLYQFLAQFTGTALANATNDILHAVDNSQLQAAAGTASANTQRILRNLRDLSAFMENCCASVGYYGSQVLEKSDDISDQLDGTMHQLIDKINEKADAMDSKLASLKSDVDRVKQIASAAHGESTAGVGLETLWRTRIIQSDLMNLRGLLRQAFV